MIREIYKYELEPLLTLYTFLHNNTMPDIDSKLKSMWAGIMSDPNHHIIVAEEDGIIVSSLVLLIVPNLTHNQRPYGVIENVITHPSFRKRGLATACLHYAREIAKKAGCYKLMLMTGSKVESTLTFYEKAGYNRLDKTAFVQWLP